MKQQITIGRNVTGIMRLPCVYSCHKDAQDKLVYLLYDWDDNGNYMEARQGDTLTEDDNGQWHVTHKTRQKG